MAGNQGRCAALCGNCRVIIGIVIVIAQGDVVTTNVVFKPVLPTYITPDFSFAHSLSVALPLFLVTMASQNAPGIAAMKAVDIRLLFRH